MTSLFRKILLTAIVAFGFIFTTNSALAVDPLVVEFQNTPHLFSETNFLPGQNVTGTARVTNNSGQPQRIATEAINYPGFPNPNNVPAGDLSRALSIIIREKGGSDLYGGSSPTGEKTLFDFYQEGETYLSDITTGATTEYEFEIAFPGEKQDEWQGATTTFDILIGFQGVEGKVSPGAGGGGGGWLPPGLTINYERPFYIGITTAKITWDTSYKSTSRVIYGTVAGVFDLNVLPNYGYAFSTAEKDTPANPNGVTNHEVWLSDLQPGTTYYFRAVSHGSLAISGEQSFTTLMPGGEVAGAATETGQTGGRGGFVAAVETGPTGSISPTPAVPAVAGESTCLPIWWWPFGYVLLLIILGVARRVGRKIFTSSGIVLRIILLIAALLWWWLEPCGAHFWVWLVLILIVFLVSLRFYLKKSSSEEMPA